MKNLKNIILVIYYLTSSIIICAQSTWVLQTSTITQNLNSIYATGNSTVFAVGNAGKACKTTNGGIAWQTMNLNSANNQYSIRFINSTTGFTAAAWQDILKTSNSGTSWTNIGGGMTDLYDCYFTSATSGWVVGDIEVGYGFLYNPFTYNLIQITAIANKALHGIYFINSTTGWIVGDGGLIIKTTNSGTAWSQKTSGTTNQLNKIVFVDVNNGFAVGNSGIILKTINGGTNWSVQNSNTTQNLNAVYFADSQNGWICGDYGTILYSNDAGLTWQTETSGTTEKLNSIHGFGINDIWACGNNGTIIYRSGSTFISENNIREKNIDVNIYPNPHLHNFFIEINKNYTLPIDLKIFTIQGKLILHENISQTTIINSENWAEGVYFYQISNLQKDFFLEGKILKK